MHRAPIELLGYLGGNGFRNSNNFQCSLANCNCHKVICHIVYSNNVYAYLVCLLMMPLMEGRLNRFKCDIDLLTPVGSNLGLIARLTTCQRVSAIIKRDGNKTLIKVLVESLKP